MGHNYECPRCGEERCQCARENRSPPSLEHLRERFRAKTPDSDPMDYMGHLVSVVSAGVALIEKKTETYGDSWKRRGGAGAWFTTVRPWDRLEKILERHGGDVFGAIAAEEGSGEDGTVLACVRDVRNYLTLIEAHMVAEGVVTTLADGSVPAGEPVEDHTPTSTRRAYPVGTPERARAVEGLERLLRDMLTVAGLGDATLTHIPDLRLNGTSVSINISIPI